MISARTREDELRIKRRMYEKEFSDIDDILKKADATLQKMNDGPEKRNLGKPVVSLKNKKVPQGRSKSTLK